MPTTTTPPYGSYSNHSHPDPGPKTSAGQRRKEQFQRKFKTRVPHNSIPTTSTGESRREAFWRKFGSQMNDSSRTKATPPHCLHIPEPTPKRTAPAQRGSASFAHKLKACRNPEKAWDLFIQEAPSELPFNSIPWPDAYGGVWSNILGVGGNASRKEVKEAHKKLQKRWHPDRFISRYQNRFSKADAERIVEKCNAITHKIIETKERFLKRK